VFCYNDLTAIGAIDATLRSGLRVPEDIAFIGCGNLRYANYLRVPLSSIDHHTEKLGKRASELVLELAADPEQAFKTILIPPTLVIRASTGGSKHDRPQSSDKVWINPDK
jgi:LacI family transcriptional regulator